MSSVELAGHDPAEVLKLLHTLRNLSDASKISSAFLPAFLYKTQSKLDKDWLHGSFNLGGTKSGRMSSSGPNLQQLPSTGTPYAKPIKRCFQAPAGWLLVGADFASLEDRISALTTRDPNKLKVYTEGYDGHCLRAYSYFADQMPDIDPTNVDSINSIEKKYKDLRQASKGPTFALTYQGTWRTLVTNFGIPEEQAHQIESQYHELYAVSDDWVQAKLEQASRDGYVTLAFGLRLRTPILSQVLLSSGKALPREVHKEMKTAGNALGQSYGLLNNRAANEFMQRVWASEYREKVLPIAQIHDSQYYVIRNTLSCLKWVNDNLIDCMRWIGLPELQHPKVKLEASLELYYPSWEKSISLPNYLSRAELRQFLQEKGLK